MVIKGFEKVRSDHVQELGIEGTLFRHRSGCQVIYLRCNDENKVFMISFSTPPKDSSGLPHIMEHSVLCGSRKYPVKEPFVELLKGSIHTFLNAFTYPDRTCYPVASTNMKDFLNLMEVYLDAVFFPLLQKFTFYQEAWHLEPKEDGGFAPKGVVYNEMKGAYSSPENLLERFSLSSLFKGHPYSFDSGGDPKEILSLTYDTFLSFHKEHYSPANSKVVLYGDLDLEASLALLDEYLSGMPQGLIRPTWAYEPVTGESGLVVSRGFPGGEASLEKGYVSLNWLLCPVTDGYFNFTFRLLELLLLGTPGSPLRRRIMESGIGEDLIGEGLNHELRYLTFHVGIKGIEVVRMEEFPPLVLRLLQECAEDVTKAEIVEGAFNLLEFHLREETEGLPWGLTLGLRCLSTWLYEGDPFLLLKFEGHLKDLKKDWERDKRLFSNIMKSWLIENTNRSVVYLLPQKDALVEMLSQESLKVREAVESLKGQDIKSEYVRFKEFQETPDSPEALKTIPRLSLGDLDRIFKDIPIEVDRVIDSPLLFHDINTAGIVYLDIGFDLAGLNTHELSLIPLIARALLEMGTKKSNYVDLSIKISNVCGGISHEWFSGPDVEGKGVAYLFYRIKFLPQQARSLFQVLMEVFFERDLGSKERFSQILKEEIARVEERVIPNGHRMVGLRAKAHVKRPYVVSEAMGGVSYLHSLKGFREVVEKDWERALARIEEIVRTLFLRHRVIFNLTCNEALKEPCLKYMEGFLKGMEQGGSSIEGDLGLFLKEREGLCAPSHVYYVAKAVDLYDKWDFDGSWLVAFRYLRNRYMWEEVRVKGGAYGAFLDFDRVGGALCLMSYRDPNPTRTLKAFDRAGEFLRDVPMDSEELERAIIGTISDLDQYHAPRRRGFVSMLRYLLGEDRDRLQVVKDQVFATALEDIRRAGEVIETIAKGPYIKILGPLEGLEGIREDLGLEMVKVL